MEYVRFGTTGMEVSRLCLGAWMFGTRVADGDEEVVDERQAHTLLDAAWERGINFIDTANVYGRGASERYLGSWLAGKDREDFVVASKVFFAHRGRQRTGLSRKILRAEIEGTLERLDTDYLDIYYLHAWHEAFSLEETLSTLNDLVHEGAIHYIGLSNFATWQVMKALWICDARGWEKPVVVQPRFNAADGVPYTVDPHEQPLPDLLDACRDQGIALCPYSPLAEGFLTGRYRRRSDGTVEMPSGSRGDVTGRFGPFPGRWWSVLEAVEAVADEVSATPAQVALRWVMDTDGVTSVPIVGGRKIAYLDDNVAALELDLSAEQRQRIAGAGASGDGASPYTYV